MLAQAVSGRRGLHPQYVYERHFGAQKARKQEIGISSIRGGTIVGEHEVIFCRPRRSYHLSHTAMSKGNLLLRALSMPPLFLQNQPAGFTRWKDLVGAFVKPVKMIGTNGGNDEKGSLFLLFRRFFLPTPSIGRWILPINCAILVFDTR